MFMQYNLPFQRTENKGATTKKDKYDRVIHEGDILKVKVIHKNKK